MNNRSSFFQKWMNENSYELILRLSLLFLLLYSGDHWFSRIPLAALSISGFIWRDLVHQSKFWFLAACFVFFEVSLHWFEADNHKYLTCYWFLTLAIISGRPLSERPLLLRRHARMYLTLCMAFAVVWKFINRDFMDHSFFELTLLTDSRFMYFTKYMTGLSLSDLYWNQDLISQFASSAQSSLALRKNVGVEQLARFMTYFTLIIETLIPISFCFFPQRLFPHFILVFFILVTYPIASVIGFAWLLIIFGLSQSDGEYQKILRPTYCSLFVLTQTFRSEVGPVLDWLFRG